MPQSTVQAMQRSEHNDNNKVKKKHTKKNISKPPRASSKKKRPSTELVVVDVSKKRKHSDPTIIGQFAKSTRCTAFWNRCHAEEAALTGNILQNEEDETDDMAGGAQTASELGFALIPDIRESKAYKTTLRQFTQEQLIHHFRCLSILRRLSGKRTADLEIVSAYQMITSCANPKLATIAYQSEEHTITNFIHTHMHNDTNEAVNFKSLRKTLRTVLPTSLSLVETREGMIEFIRKYTGDCYFK